ncbi:hypothetical protein EPN83_00480 [Patescibacteria group bacterium]|nr:MAG: hypothetical protein EPN83_00480 [Patescibacteria group bacterium]
MQQQQRREVPEGYRSLQAQFRDQETYLNDEGCSCGGEELDPEEVLTIHKKESRGGGRGRQWRDCGESNVRLAADEVTLYASAFMVYLEDEEEDRSDEVENGLFHSVVVEDTGEFSVVRRTPIFGDFPDEDLDYDAE